MDTASFDTAEHDATYYDPEPIRQVFGPDAKERMLEETDGLGYAKSTLDGEVWHRNRHTGDVERLRDEPLDSVYLGGRNARENR